MSQIRIPNDKIACDPLAINLELEKKNAVAFLKNKTTLLPTKVVFASNDEKHPYVAGDTVFLRGDCITLPWVKEPYEIDGKKVILVPCDQIQAWDFGHRIASCPVTEATR